LQRFVSTVSKVAGTGAGAARQATAVVTTTGAQQVRWAHHHNYDSVDTPPPTAAEKLDTRIKKALQTRNAVGYNAAWSLFTTEDGKQINDNADAETCATMLDHSYSGEKQEFVADSMAEQWVTPSANAFAARINWHQVMGEDAAAASVLKDMIGLKVEPNLRLQRLLYRKPKKLEEAQLLVLRRAVEYGQKDDAWGIFERFDSAGVTTLQQYITMVWSLDSHAAQMQFLDRMEAAGGEEAWDLHADVFAAQFMTLQNEDRYDDLQVVLDSMLAQGIEQTDKTMYALKRAGQRMRKQRRVASEDRMSWDMEHSLDSAPRRRVGI